MRAVITAVKVFALVQTKALQLVSMQRPSNTTQENCERRGSTVQTALELCAVKTALWNIETIPPPKKKQTMFQAVRLASFGKSKETLVESLLFAVSTRVKQRRE